MYENPDRGMASWGAALMECITNDLFTTLLQMMATTHDITSDETVDEAIV